MTKLLQKQPILIISIACLLWALAIGLTVAKDNEYEPNIVLDKSQNVLAIKDRKTVVQPGISNADLDKVNQYDTEAIKLFMKQLSYEYDVDWKLVYAIGYHESGNYSSGLARSQNNFFGRKASSAGYASWATPQDGIRNQFEYLKTRYFDRGLNTPESINRVYAEDMSWSGKVRSVMNNLEG